MLCSLPSRSQNWTHHHRNKTENKIIVETLHEMYSQKTKEAFFCNGKMEFYVKKLTFYDKMIIKNTIHFQYILTARTTINITYKYAWNGA